jgi:hypothetical protein
MIVSVMTLHILGISKGKINEANIQVLCFASISYAAQGRPCTILCPYIISWKKWLTLTISLMSRIKELNWLISEEMRSFILLSSLLLPLYFLLFLKEKLHLRSLNYHSF